MFYKKNGRPKKPIVIGGLRHNDDPDLLNGALILVTAFIIFFALISLAAALAAAILEVF